MAVSAATLDFASQAFGTQSASKTITITNSGSGVLNISSITVGGTQSGAFIANHLCTYVTVGGTCVVSVGVKPLEAGAHSASLSINSDGGTQAVTEKSISSAEPLQN